MRAINHDAHAVQPQVAGEGALGEFDVARLAVVNALGAADLGAGSKALFQARRHQAFDFHFDIVRQFLAVGAEELDAVILIQIVRGCDHHPDIGAQAARQYGDGRRRQGTELEHIHADGGEARHQRGFDHVAGQARILADHHPVTMLATGKYPARRHAGLHRHFRREYSGVGAAADAVGAKIFAGHAGVLMRDGYFVTIGFTKVNARSFLGLPGP